MRSSAAIVLLSLLNVIDAHTAAWAPGMYCRGGSDPSTDNPNTDVAIGPLFNLKKKDWWFQQDRGCDLVPPPANEFLTIPAGGSFTVELAHNRAFTTLSYNGERATNWPDGKEHPENYNAIDDPGSEKGCLSNGALHASNQSTAAGTAFAISYVSSLAEVTLGNLVVFTTLAHTPWKRMATYSVPAALPACPSGGCICAWLWVPKNCGQSNIYMQGFRCNVTGARSTAAVAAAQPSVFCEGDQSKCVKGAKQMIVWNQAEGNNIVVPVGASPGYNVGCGWKDGAQDDIFGKTTEPSCS